MFRLILAESERSPGRDQSDEEPLCIRAIVVLQTPAASKELEKTRASGCTHTIISQVYVNL